MSKIKQLLFKKFFLYNSYIIIFFILYIYIYIYTHTHTHKPYCFFCTCFWIVYPTLKSVLTCSYISYCVSSKQSSMKKKKLQHGYMLFNRFSHSAVKTLPSYYPPPLSRSLSLIYIYIYILHTHTHTHRGVFYLCDRIISSALGNVKFSICFLCIRKKKT